MLHSQEYTQLILYLIIINLHSVSCSPRTIHTCIVYMQSLSCRIFLFASGHLHNFMYPHVLPHTPSLSNTFCSPVLCTLWGPVCVLCSHQHVVVHVCVCAGLCSLCTRAWKHVPVLVMLHSHEHPDVSHRREAHCGRCRMLWQNTLLLPACCMQLDSDLFYMWLCWPKFIILYYLKPNCSGWAVKEYYTCILYHNEKVHDV